MSAYAISEVEMRDAADFEAYRAIAAKTIAQYGGRYLVRGGAANLIEGGPPPKTIVVVEFPTAERLREWYASLRALRRFETHGRFETHDETPR